MIVEVKAGICARADPVEAERRAADDRRADCRLQQPRGGAVVAVRMRAGNCSDPPVPRRRDNRRNMLG